MMVLIFPSFYEHIIITKYYVNTFKNNYYNLQTINITQSVIGQYLGTRIVCVPKKGKYPIFRAAGRKNLFFVENNKQIKYSLTFSIRCLYY